ncbi:hypothetical protein HYX17_04155 [Candidatus Woesearchaeota archaeon]|nr:hypothetical protein [Candidatus Woesearchaeota archaeon]
MAESELLKALKHQESIKGVFSWLEKKSVEVEALPIDKELIFSFKVAQAKSDYAFLTMDGIVNRSGNTLRDEDRIYLHPYGSSIVYKIKEKKKGDK